MNYKSIKIAIVDDEELFASKIQNYIKECLHNTIYQGISIELFYSSDTFLSRFKPYYYDLVVLDIYLDKITGIDIAKSIRDKDIKTKIVFCTSSNEFASESYSVNAFYYLLKPIDKSSIKRLMDKLGIGKIDSNNTILFPNGMEIKTNRLIYTEYSNHVVKLYLSDSSIHQIRMRQRDLEKILLDDEKFYSPIKGIIINFSYVKSLNNNIFILNNEEEVFITRTKIKEARIKYMNYKFKNLKEESLKNFGK